MAKPQVENGYIRIATELFEQLYSRKFSHSELRILLFTMRYTYGFNRKDAILSNSFISKGTGIHQINVSTTVNQLIKDRTLIEVSAPTFESSRKLRVNKNYDSWLNHEQLAKTLTVSEKSQGVSKITKRGVSEMTNIGVSDLANQDNTTKDNTNEDNTKEDRAFALSDKKYDSQGRKLNEAGFPIIDYGLSGRTF